MLGQFCIQLPALVRVGPDVARSETQFDLFDLAAA
jgi:hypothetical protein